MENKKKDEIISISLIIFYVVLNSFLMQKYEYTDFRFLLFNLIFLVGIVIFIKKEKLDKYYGFCKVNNCKKFLYFIPLIIISLVNIWAGFSINNTLFEICIYMAAMFCVGFLEEVIFRGFLFKMMSRDNLKSAIIVSSLTFGIGHIVNLFNGAPLVPTLFQICYAVLLGFLFVIIFVKSGSLWPSIITHGIFNALGVFSVDSSLFLYAIPVILIIICILYVLCILYFDRREKNC